MTECDKIAGQKLARSPLPQESRLSKCASVFCRRFCGKGRAQGSRHTPPPIPLQASSLIKQSSSRLSRKVCCLSVKQGLGRKECCPSVLGVCFSTHPGQLCLHDVLHWLASSLTTPTTRQRVGKPFAHKALRSSNLQPPPLYFDAISMGIKVQVALPFCDH